MNLNDARGCLRNLDDYRDIVLGDTPFTPDPNCPSWESGFNNEDKYGKLVRDHQGHSLSCVGRAWSKYLEMLDNIETNNNTRLSAKDVYSQIFLPSGGAYIREGAKVCVNAGVCREELIPSITSPWFQPLSGSNPDEIFMRKKEQTSETRADALVYRSKNFVFVPVSSPFRSEDWDNIRQVIWQFGGFVSGWARHCVYALGYGIKDGHRFVHFANSYGEGSDWYLWEGPTNYKYYNCRDYALYDITYVVDLPNPPYKINMLKIIGDLRDNRQYILGKDNRLHWIFGQPGQDSAVLMEFHDAGVIDKNQVEWVNTLDGYVLGSPWVASR